MNGFIRARGALIIVPLAVAALLAGCSGKPAQKTPTQPEPKLTSISLPMQSLQPGTAVEYAKGMAADDSGPPIAVGTTTAPGSPSQLAIFDATGEVRHTFDSQGEADFQDALSTGGRTYLVGQTWTGSKLSNWLRTSADRRRWTTQRVPADLAERDVRLTAVTALSGNRVLLLGIDSAGRGWAEPSNGQDAVALPQPGKGQRLNSIQAATNGHTILATAEINQGGDSTRLAAYRSTDAGKTWRQVSAPSDRHAELEVFPFEDGFLGVGSFRATARPAAWFTTDGDTWKFENVPMGDFQPTWKAYLTGASVRDGELYAIGVNEVSQDAQVLRRSKSGWIANGSTTRWNYPGADGIAIPTDNGVRVARSARGRGVVDQTSFGQSERISTQGTKSFTGNWWNSAVVAGSPKLTYRRITIASQADGGWSSTSLTQIVGLRGTRADIASFGPITRKLPEGPVISSSEDGSAVVIGTSVHVNAVPGQGDDSDVSGWFRARKGNWKKLTGLAGPKTEWLVGINASRGGWVATGYVRDDYYGREALRGAAWTSKDGLRWARVPFDFATSGTANSWLESSCTTGKTTVVLGSQETKTGTSAFGYYKTPKAPWRKLDLRPLGSRLPSFNDCATLDGQVLLQTDTADGPAIWITRDFQSFRAVKPGSPGDTIGTIRDIPGGFAATGSIDHGLTRSSVIWLSSDAEHWLSVPTKVTGTARLIQAMPAAKKSKLRLLIAAETAGGPVLKSLDNVDELLTFSKARHQRG